MGSFEESADDPDSSLRALGRAFYPEEIDPELFEFTREVLPLLGFQVPENVLDHGRGSFLSAIFRSVESPMKIARRIACRRVIWPSSSPERMDSIVSVIGRPVRVF